ncbi:TP53-regulating kinase [Smittium mucronatum]|uniref:non-specific serine/threonine protein kinase n=1 Tax=Smittium mucronatum TaxID=133383 RepID=A0A1R0GT08_9FUNG|nr:TP53-regulating kinase [Smittium mucronatum]OLY85447.1 TP53-regulating kinase [Smittium mucronatum]
MEYVVGEMVKTILARGGKEGLGEEVGRVLAKMHDCGIIHGDLTTSNMIFNENEGLVLIDFGLGFSSDLAEDKAVDLYVFERALISTTPDCDDFLDSFYKSYSSISTKSKGVLDRLQDVRIRGRKRDMTG